MAKTEAKHERSRIVERSSAKRRSSSGCSDVLWDTYRSRDCAGLLPQEENGFLYTREDVQRFENIFLSCKVGNRSSELNSEKCPYGMSSKLEWNCMVGEIYLLQRNPIGSLQPILATYRSGSTSIKEKMFIGRIERVERHRLHDLLHFWNRKRYKEIWVWSISFGVALKVIFNHYYSKRRTDR